MTIFKYCPQCAKPLEQKGDNSFCPACNLTHYQNSKPTVGILPIKNGKVLLARRGEEPNKGALDTIGGFLNYGEHPVDGAKREAVEETGQEIDNLEFFDIAMDEYGEGGLLLQGTFYTCTIADGELTPMDDIASLEWVDIDSLPLDSSLKSITEILEKLKSWYQKDQATSGPL